jgi:hypothetical protein
MPDQDESTPAPIPRIDPAVWEDHEGFRETFLLHYTAPEANQTLRRLGGLMFNQALERVDLWPKRPESSTRAELLAAVADLRFLEGYLGAVGQEHVISSLSSGDNALSQRAAGWALEVGGIAAQIEEELVRWKS